MQQAIHMENGKQLMELQYGQLLVKAETHYITCDPLAYFEPKKALKAREAFFFGMLLLLL